MAERQAATRLRVYFAERDRWRGQPLAHALVRLAQRHGLAGATVLRAVDGYGTTGEGATPRAFRRFGALPLIMETIDRPERIEAFLPHLACLLSTGMVTLDPVEVIFYGRPASAPGRSGVAAHGDAAGGT